MQLTTLRWATRSVLSVLEVLLIGYIIYLIFGGGELNPEMTNALSVVVGGLLLNFGKSSGLWFSQESNAEKEDKSIEKKA